MMTTVDSLVFTVLRQMPPVRWLWGKWKVFREERNIRKISTSFKDLDQLIKYIEPIDWELMDYIQVTHKYRQNAGTIRNFFEPFLEKIYVSFRLRNAIYLNSFVQYYRHGTIQTGSIQSRNVFLSLFKALDIDFKGASFLDLGPGSGDSLDLAHENGATRVDFVDYNPYFLMFNNLKGFRGYSFDYMNEGLTKLSPNKYDVIFSKGAMNADSINRREPAIPFPTWLDQLENLASAGCKIVICPTFDRGKKQPYVCKDVEAFRQSLFSRALLDRGYEIIFIEGFNEPKEVFPFTFYKRLDGPLLGK